MDQAAFNRLEAVEFLAAHLIQYSGMRQKRYAEVPLGMAKSKDVARQPERTPQPHAFRTATKSSQAIYN